MINSLPVDTQSNTPTFGIVFRDGHAYLMQLRERGDDDVDALSDTMIPTDTHFSNGRETVSRWRAEPYALPNDAAVEVSAFCFNEDDQLIIVSHDGAAWALPLHTNGRARAWACG